MHIRLLGGFFLGDGTKGPPIGIGPTLIIGVTKFNQNAEFLVGSQAHLFLPAAVLVEFSRRVSSPMRLCARFVVPVTSYQFACFVCALSAAVHESDVSQEVGSDIVRGADADAWLAVCVSQRRIPALFQFSACKRIRAPMEINVFVALSAWENGMNDLLASGRASAFY